MSDVVKFYQFQQFVESDNEDALLMKQTGQVACGGDETTRCAVLVKVWRKRTL